MLTLTALVVSLSGALVPSQATLLGAAPEARRSAALTSEAPALGTGVLLAQAEEAPPTPPPGVAQPAAPAGPKTLQQLRDERAALDQSRPGIGGGIAMLAVGVVLDFIGIPFGAYGLVFLFSNFFLPVASGSTASTVLTVVGFVMLGVGIVALGVGIPLTIIGAIKLARSLRERRAIGEQMNVIDEQIRVLEEGATPPPPVMPNSVENNARPAPALVVAEF